MAFFEANVEKLKERTDGLDKALIGSEVLWNPDCVSTEEAKNGERIIVYKGRERVFYLNSKYNPTKETEKFMADAIDVPKNSALIMFGFANGFFAREFLRKNDKEATCFIYEPDISIFMRALHDLDLRDLLEDDRVVIVVEGLNSRLLESILPIYITRYNIETNKNLILPNYAQLFPDKYEEFSEILRNAYVEKKVLNNTMTATGKRIAYTSIQNMRFLPGCRSGRDYEGRFPEDLPAIVVSAGPSLEKNVELLKELKGRALIVVVDSAIRPVMSRGIVPDMVISVDINKGMHFFDVEEEKFKKLQEIFFLAHVAMNTDVLEQIQPKNLAFYASDTEVWHKLFGMQGTSLYNINFGNSVAIDALTLMITWGFKKIILIGQDLALTGNKNYADGKEIEDKNKVWNGAVYVKDIYGNDVLTRRDYQLFVKEIESIAHACPEVEVIDATEGGAFKKHTTIMTLREAIDTYCKNTYDLDSLIQSMPRLFTEDHSHIIVDTLKQMKNNIKNIGKQMAQGAADCKKAGIMLSRGVYNVKELKQINTSIAKLDEKFSAMDELSLIEKCAYEAKNEFDSTIFLEEENEIENSISLYKKTEKYYHAISEVTPELVEMIDDCLEKITKG